MTNFDGGASADAGLPAADMDEEEKKRQEAAAVARAAAAPNPLVAQAPPAPALTATVPSAAAPVVAPPPQAVAGELPLVKAAQTTTSGWSRVVPHKSEAGIAEKQRKTDAEMELLTLEQGTNAILKAQTEQQAANKALEQTVQDKAELDNALGNANWLIDKEEAREKELRDKWMSMENKDYWADKTTGQKVLATLAMALGAFGRALSGRGGENRAIAALDKIVAADLAKKQAAQDKMFKAMELQGGNVRRAYDKMGLSVQNYNLRKAADWERVEKEARTLMAAQGLDDAEIDGKIKQLGIQEKREAAEMERAMSLRSRVEGQTVTQRVQGVPGAAGGKPTEGQLDAAGALGLLSSSLEQISGAPILDQKALEKIQQNRTKLEGAKVTGPVSAFLVNEFRDAKLIPKAELEGLNAEQKRSYLAWQDARSNMMKVMTGLGFSVEEKKDADVRYTPQPGDDPATIKAKFEGAKRFARELSVKAGALGPGIQRRIDQLPSAPGSNVPANANAANTNAAPGSRPPPGVPAGARRFQKRDGTMGWLAGDLFVSDAELNRQTAAR